MTDPQYYFDIECRSAGGGEGGGGGGGYMLYTFISKIETCTFHDTQHLKDLYLNLTQTWQ